MIFSQTRRTALVISLACACTTLAPRAAAAEWRRVDTPNFIVIGDVSARELGRIATHFESFRETLSRILSERATAAAVPTVVIVFPNARAFEPFQPQFQGKAVVSSGAFHADRDFNYITILNDGRPDGMRVIFHEYAHLVISNIAMNLPEWLNEGLAEYYSTFELERGGREARVGRAIDSHLRVLATSTPLPIEQLVRVDRSSPLYNEGERRSVFYAQSWALTHMILLGTPSRAGELAGFIGQVNDGVPAADAWQHAFRGVPIEGDLRLYLRRGAFRMERYRFAEKLSALEATSAPMAQPDVDAMLAALYLRQRRFDDARRLAGEVLEKDPGHHHANAVIARVEIERGDLVSAATRLAAPAPSEDWYVAYSAGVALADVVSRSSVPASAHVDAARKHLEAAHRRRNVPNVYAQLALLELASPFGRPAQALASILQGRALAPGRDDYALIEARARAEIGEYDAARRIYQALMRPGFPPHIRETARQWMDNVARMESSRLKGIQRTTGGFRARLPGEERIEGLLEGISCPAAAPAMFHVRTGAGPETLFAPDFSSVQFITYRRDLKGSVVCGPLKEPLPVYLTWKAGSSPSTKLVVAVEFLPVK